MIPIIPRATVDQIIALTHDPNSIVRVYAQAALAGNERSARRVAEIVYLRRGDRP